MFCKFMSVKRDGVAARRNWCKVLPLRLFGRVTARPSGAGTPRQLLIQLGLEKATAAYLTLAVQRFLKTLQKSLGSRLWSQVSDYAGATG